MINEAIIQPASFAYYALLREAQPLRDSAAAYIAASAMDLNAIQPVLVTPQVPDFSPPTAARVCLSAGGAAAGGTARR